MDSLLGFLMWRPLKNIHVIVELEMNVKMINMNAMKKNIHVEFEENVKMKNVEMIVKYPCRAGGECKVEIS